jgi:hypothetical protein
MEPVVSKSLNVKACSIRLIVHVKRSLSNFTYTRRFCVNVGAY